MGVTELLSRANRASPISPPVAVKNRVIRLTHTCDLDAYDVAIDPFRTHAISPDDISRFTGRPYPPVVDRFDALGTVASGDWDRAEEVEFVDESYRPRYEALYLAESFEESVFHTSMVGRFVEGAAWEETELVTRSLSLIERGQRAWRGATTRFEIDALCEMADELYATISREDYRSQRELGKRALTHLVDEICVDIARDGTPLFVDGKHRLSMAKILGVEAIRVAVLWRHQAWVERLEGDT